MEEALGLGRFAAKKVKGKAVLILVLMEEALGHHLCFPNDLFSFQVLILVLMEEALGRSKGGGITTLFRPCLNPCFNGRSTRTLFEKLELPPREVLILVLMEEALGLLLHRKRTVLLTRLNPCFNGRSTRTCKT